MSAVAATLSLLMLGATATATPARADPCAPIKTAYEKLATAPAYRQTIVSVGQPPIEMMAIGDMLYVKDDGDWRGLKTPPDRRLAMMQSVFSQGLGLTQCAELPPETLEGAAVKVYSYQPPAMGDLGESGPQTLWVGSADGLPRKMTAYALEVRIGYDGVKAPKR